VDLFSMKAVRSIQVGFTGPSLAVSWDGRYIAALVQSLRLDHEWLVLVPILGVAAIKR